MSSRFRLIPVVPSAYYWNRYASNDGHTVVPPPGILCQPPAYNAVDEYIVSDDDKKKRQFKPCEHWKFTAQSTGAGSNHSYWLSTNHSLGTWITRPPEAISSIWDGSAASDLGNPSGVFGKWIDPSSGLPALLGTVPDGGRYVIGPSDLGQLIQASLNAMLPGIRPRLSLVNSILELKDFKSLPRTVDKLRNLPQSLRPRGRWTLRKILKKTKKSVNTASDSYLQYQFNLAPLVSDISGIATTLVSVRQELEELVKRANRRQVRHYRRDLADRYADNLDSRDVQVANPTWICQSRFLYSRRVTYPVRSFNATIEYSYSIPSLSNELMLVGAILDSLGVNFNPAIIWNAIPWSFVVDWVMNVSSFLKNYSVRNIEPVTVIRQYCWSLNVRRLISCSCGADALIHVGTHDQEVYLRSVGIPDVWRSIALSGLSSKEFSLIGALAGSRLR